MGSSSRKTVAHGSKYSKRAVKIKWIATGKRKASCKQRVKSKWTVTSKRTVSNK